MFEHLVDLTEPICREIDAKKADYFIYDTTGIELPVAENNPKFFNTKLREAKKLSKSNSNLDPYTILNPNVDKYARGFFVVPRRSPAGLLAASQGDSTQAQRKRRRRIVYIWVENSITRKPTDRQLARRI